MFIVFECFYSAGVFDLKVKTIREFTHEEFLAAKQARGRALKAFKSVYLCLFSISSPHVENFITKLQQIFHICKSANK